MKSYSEIFNEIKKCKKLKDYVLEKCEQDIIHPIAEIIEDKIRGDIENIFGKDEDFKNIVDILPVYLEHTETRNNYINIKNLDSFIINTIKSNIYDISGEIFNKNKNFRNKTIEKDIQI